MENSHRESKELKQPIILKHNSKENVHYPFFCKNIPKEFEVVLLKELNETEENRKLGILKLKDFLKSKRISGVDESILLVVLRNCKYDIEKSKKKLLSFLRIRNKYLKKLQEADMDRLEKVVDNNVVGVLPYRDKDGRAIAFSTPNIDFDLFDIQEAQIVYFSFILYNLTFPLTSVAGISYIAEAKAPSISIFYPIMKLFRKNILEFLSVPLRIGRIEIINTNFIVTLTLNLIRPLMPLKIVERVSIYGSDIQNLQKLYPPDLLPEEFGGTMGPLSSKFLKKDFLNFLKRLKMEKVIDENSM